MDLRALFMPPPGRLTKTMRIMKLSAILLLIGFLQVQAHGYGQRITLSGKDLPLEKVFRTIYLQTGYQFIYNDETLQSTHRINISVKDASLREVLDICFRDQSLEYVVGDGTIVIRPRQQFTLDPQKTTAPSPPVTIDVTGKVVNENGEPLPGTTISIRSTGQAAVTNEKGEFTLKGVSSDAILIISSVSMLRQELSLNHRTVLLITLRKLVNDLDQTVIKGYYNTTRRLNTGNVSTVKSEDIEKQPVTDPILALQGQVPGLFIQQTSGLPGAPVNVNIRGINSISSNTIPLYIVDGVPFGGNPIDQQNQSATSMYIANSTTGAGNDPFNLINPQDIDRIEVLKDADATAIYGSRGANGVILITTKKGKAGKTDFSLNAYTGTGKVNRFLPTLSTSQYLDIRRKAFANDGITPTPDNAPDLFTWSPTDNVNYQKKFIGNSSASSEISASLSGGSQQTNFLLSGTIHNETPVMPGSSHYSRGTLNMTINHTSADGRLKLDLSTLYATENNHIYGPDMTANSITLPGNYPLYQNGALYWGGGLSNPLGQMTQSFKSSASNLFLHGAISYTLLPGLQARVSVGMSKAELDQKILMPGTIYNSAYNAPDIGVYVNTNNKTYIAEPQLDYNTRIWKGKFGLTGGGTWQHTDYETPYFIYAMGFPSIALMDNWTSATNILEKVSTSSQYKYVSGYGRLNYNIEEKYILNATFRRDGSSRFGPDRKFGNFGSIGAAWIFSEESFVKPLHWLSYGKLRGSYGTVGNDQFDNYAYLDTYSPTASTYGPAAGYVPTQIANPNFSWETTHKVEGAAELGFMDNKILFTTSWFLNRSTNLLVDYPLAPQTGFSSYKGNLDAVIQNKGFEMELKVTPVDHAAFKWNFSFNISIYRNKLVSFPGLLNSTYVNQYVIGQSLNLVTGYHFTGFTNGQATVADLNKDGNLSQGIYANGQGDFAIAGTTDPKYFGGFNNSLHYKQWQLDLLFNFTGQKKYSITSFPGLLSNQYKDAATSQFTPSTLSSSPSYTSYINYYTLSDARFTDASFVRLKNLSLSYAFPDRWLKAAKIKNLRIYARGQNLFVITKYKGFDPDTPVWLNTYNGSISASIPPLRILTAGIQCSF